MISRVLILCSLVLLSTSCYRMPEEGEVSVLPITNNPTITHPDAENGGLPGLPGIGL